MNPNTNLERPHESTASESDATKKPWRKPRLVELDLSRTESGISEQGPEDPLSGS